MQPRETKPQEPREKEPSGIYLSEILVELYDNLDEERRVKNWDLVAAALSRVEHAVQRIGDDVDSCKIKDQWTPPYVVSEVVRNKESCAEQMAVVQGFLSETKAAWGVEEFLRLFVLPPDVPTPEPIRQRVQELTQTGENIFDNLTRKMPDFLVSQIPNGPELNVVLKNGIANAFSDHVTERGVELDGIKLLLETLFK